MTSSPRPDRKTYMKILGENIQEEEERREIKGSQRKKKIKNQFTTNINEQKS